MVFFDIDGTLMDDDGAVRAACLALRAAPGRLREQPPDDFAAAWLEIAERHFRRYLAGQVSFQEQRRARLREVFGEPLPDEEADALFAYYLQCQEANWRLFPDVLPCLVRLGGRPVGIISNGDGEQQRRKLERTGIVDRFSPVVISGDVGAAKPAAAIFHHACRLAGVSPKECTYVGDRPDADARGSLSAGMRPVLIDRAGALGEHAGIRVARSLDEVSRWL